MTEKYSKKEVSHHNSEDNLWLILHGGVYNLTKFLSVHPGGDEVLLNLGGKDGTTCFDDIGHSMEAIQLRETFKIGELSIGETNDMIESSESSTDLTSGNTTEWMIEKEKQKVSPLVSSFIVILAVIYALIFYYLR